jgi:hypothetical protein
MRGIISKCSNFLNMGREQTCVTTCILKEAIQSVNNFSFLLNPQQQEYGRANLVKCIQSAGIYVTYEKYGNSTTRQHSRFCKLCTDSPAYLKRCDGSRILQSEFIAVYKHQYAGRQVSSNLVSTAA